MAFHLNQQGITYIDLANAIVAATAAQTGVDVSDYKGNACLHGRITTGLTSTNGDSTCDVKLQHSDDDSTYSDVGAAYAFTQADESAGTTEEITVDMGILKKYVRAYVTVGGGESDDGFGVAVTLICQA